MAETKERSEDKPIKASGVNCRRRYCMAITLLIFLVCAGLGYFTFRQHQQLAVLLPELSLMQDNATVLKKQILSQKQRIQKLEKTLSDHPLDISTLRQREAQHAIFLASLSLSYQHDTQSALNLLRLAHHRLKGVCSSAQDALDQDLASLKAIKKMTLTQWLKRLARLQTQLKTAKFSSRVKQAKKLPEKTAKDSWSNLQSIFSRLIVVRHDQTLRVLPLTPENQRLLKQAWSLLLQEAEWAVVTGHADVYQKSLARLRESVVHHPQFQQRAEWLTEIKTLQDFSWPAALPDLKQTQKALAECSTEAA